MDGKLLEGSDVKLSCKSSDGSDPISYKWERVLDKGKSLGKLPTLALIGERDNWRGGDVLIHRSGARRNAPRRRLISVPVIFIGYIHPRERSAERDTLASPPPDLMHF